MKKINRDPYIEVPPGKYWLGDPCYVIKDEHWIPWLHNAYGEGDPNQCNVFLAKIGGSSLSAMAFATAYGDGTYEDYDGNEYPVDAGLIGLVPIEYGEPNFPEGVHLVVFNRPTICKRDGGVLIFGEHEINTE